MKKTENSSAKIIPGKTFLVGEYAALADHPAILFLTKPCFTIDLIDKPILKNIHQDSPAGLYWLKYGLKNKGLIFNDPYNGLGGMGASSAQFLGAYLFCNNLINYENLIKDYQKVSWQGKGLKPSGYDVLAQSNSSFCVYIEKNPLKVTPLDYCFKNFNIIFAHTGKKCQTHKHLLDYKNIQPLNDLAKIIYKTKKSIEEQNSDVFFECINDYSEALFKYGWVSVDTKNKIDFFKKLPYIKALKGCGAMGSDIIIFFVDKDKTPLAIENMVNHGLKILTIE